MKKFKNVFLCLMLALVMVVPVLLTGCGAGGATGLDIAKLVTQSAENFYAQHLDYEHYADATYNVTVKGVDSGKDAVAYKKNATDAELTTEQFDFSAGYDINAVVSFKNLDEDDLGFYMHVTYTEKETGYRANEETYALETFSNQETDTYEYVVSKNETGYFWTLVSTNNVGTEDEATTREYYQFETRADYVDFVTGLIKQSQRIVFSESFYMFAQGEGLEMMLLSNYSLDNGVVTVTAGYSAPVIGFSRGDDDEYHLETYYASYDAEAKVDKNGPLSFRMSVVEGNVNYGEYQTTQTLNATNSAQGSFEVPAIGEGWVAPLDGIDISLDFNAR